MAANRYILRLYQFGTIRRQVEASLDPRDDSRLRELLEQQVQAYAGSLRLDLSHGWKLVVLTAGATGPGRIHAVVTVNRSGRTVVKR